MQFCCFFPGFVEVDLFLCVLLCFCFVVLIVSVCGFLLCVVCCFCFFFFCVSLCVLSFVFLFCFVFVCVSCCLLWM